MVAGPLRRGPARRAAGPALAAATALALTLGACDAGGPAQAPAPQTPASASPSQDAPAPEASPDASTPAPTPTTSATPSMPGEVTASATTVVDGLDVPWGIDALPDGRLVLTLRGGSMVVVDPSAGSVTDVGGSGARRLADGTRPDGEAGLLGVALSPSYADDSLVYVYRTGGDGNAVLRGTLDVTGTDPVLRDLTTVLDGIPKAANHDGGRLAFGPDGDLYVTAGDAHEPSRAQDPDSLGGKILRITPDGDPAGARDGSPVWSLGHRNPQGLGWTADGVMIAAEFGQDTYDELNVIGRGQNYGWPDVEGVGGDDAADAGFTDPVEQWTTDEASPSGIAVVPDAVYLAALRGERLWRVPWAADPDGALDGQGRAGGLTFGEPQSLLEGDHGRLRAVLADPADASGRTLYVLTNNTDGRGDPRDGDDRLLRVSIAD
ncbi:sorbosone dehydrogenase family protein [Cellulomonas sp. PhB143]|uniref:PQQ-dependent sugar dehydrogenase n=1 Tax=Cellulomonas sp. PhB143 TaxID=2485186 RepID=UPI000F46123B|nr:PQQ-dependent sugar dehydrogenase [Cellulomonas sp. PhB143]ROS78709.1 glucose/arabinose dehydrogenase [Cellulomonas sp. PhB143]